MQLSDEELSEARFCTRDEAAQLLRLYVWRRAATALAVLGGGPVRYVDRTDDAPPSERMRRLGIVQADDPALRRPCDPFELPADRDLARSVGELLAAFLHPFRAAHSFGKGMGRAAPQIGVARRAAVVQAPDQPPIVLFNPRVRDASGDADEQCEGCLSFFDVRGIVTRALHIDVEHAALDGSIHITRFEHAAARLWAHEIDHLDGKLHTDRMSPGVDPVPVDRYDGTASSWRYGPDASLAPAAGRVVLEVSHITYGLNDEPLEAVASVRSSADSAVVFDTDETSAPAQVEQPGAS